MLSHIALMVVQAIMQSFTYLLADNLSTIAYRANAKRMAKAILPIPMATGLPMSLATRMLTTIAVPIWTAYVLSSSWQSNQLAI